jgi:hypothetical protein
MFEVIGFDVKNSGFIKALMNGIKLAKLNNSANERHTVKKRINIICFFLTGFKK